jgi:MoaA/NifB/PqqE/SkfB family radical SAM enzyme
MTAQEYERFWPNLVGVAPAAVVFTGGEPLVRPDVFELLRSLRRVDRGRTIRLCFNTNGVLVTRAVAQGLAEVVDEVRVSVDGFEEENDALRGHGSFKAAMRSIRRFIDVGLSPVVLVTVSKSTISELEHFLVFLFEQGVVRIKLNLLRPFGRAANDEMSTVSRDEMSAAFARAWETVFGQSTTERTSANEPQSNCGVGRFLNILPNGDVFPCHVLTNARFRCGNVRKTALEAICGSDGILQKLSGIDFRVLASRDPRLEELTRPGVCMAHVWSKTRDSTPWQELVQIEGI